MAFLIRTIAVAKSGREIPRDRTLETGELIVGRAPECDIHLADLTVELQHLRIADAGGGMLQASAVGELPFTLDGSVVNEGTIDPNAGGTISVGPANLEISRDDDGPVQIIISQAKKTGAASEPTAGFALASAMPSKRAMAWTMSLAILVLLLTVPIVTHLTRDTSVEGQGPDAPRFNQVSFDSTWSSGALSLAHHDLEDNCEACHSTPFVTVQDETCLTCHEELGDHAEKPRLDAGMAPLTSGEAWQWAVAETLGNEGPGSCTSCHLEHEGNVRLEAATEEFCAECHTALDTRLTDVAFGNADNFGAKHPQFRPTFYNEYNQDEPVRTSLDQPIEEKSGLIFPHDIHMEADGGVARMAISLDQYGKALECSNCHELTDDKIGYKPIEMEPACEACHSLVADRDASGAFTSLRHGDVADLMEDLRTMGKGPKRAVVTGRSRPGQFANGGAYAINFGRPASSLIAINRALLPGGTCGDCHIGTTTEGRPDLIPVNLPDRFLMHGFFTHAGHEDEECAACHEAEASEKATDLLMPDVESCQDCHSGATLSGSDKPFNLANGIVGMQDRGEKVASSCAMCHGYHTPTAPWPGDHPILQSIPKGMREKSTDSIASISAMLKD
ncbi:MAG: cytochrome c3 family protein [Erythrobacter sp.]|nr:cytochrome c3 family protein [Erythrobacter sp.]